MRAEPVYKTLPGWRTNTVGILDYGKLPQAARDYIAFLEGEIGAEAALISTGPRREETILKPCELLEKWTGGRLAQVIEQRGA